MGAVLYQFSVEARLEGLSFAIDRKLSDHFVDSGLVAVNVAALGAVVFMAWPRQPCRRRLLSWVLIAGTLVVAAVGAGLLGARWHSGFAAHYDVFMHTGVFRFLETVDPHSTRICVLTPRSYPFAGSRRQSLVLQAHKTAAQPERFRSPQSLLEHLRDQRATMVAITPQSTAWNDAGIDEWADQHPGLFTTVWKDHRFVLKRIDYDSLVDALSSSKVIDPNLAHARR